MNAAGNIGQAAIGGATALGAGQVGAANAMAGAYGKIGNAGMMYSFLNRPSAATGANAMGPVYGQQPLGSSFAPFQVG
jgi:hypothetical protein